VDAAATPADAMKLQTYTAETMTLVVRMPGFVIEDPKSLWDRRQLYELYQEAHTPWQWHRPIMGRVEAQGMACFSTPFDATAMNFLESLGVPAHKIASFEVIELPLIRYAASTGKPMIISTGMASRDEIDEAVDATRGTGYRELAGLRCASGYPAPAQDYDLRTLADMQHRYEVVTGLSDHTLDNTTAIASVALGAAIIEKHFTLNRSGGGPDDSFSLEPKELTALCSTARVAWNALGAVRYGPAPSERSNVKFRRSIYFVKDLSAGDVITQDAIRVVRPGFGELPKHFETLIGRRVKQQVEQNTPVRRDLLMS
jgi:pseudaminic acid synthase